MDRACGLGVFCLPRSRGPACPHYPVPDPQKRDDMRRGRIKLRFLEQYTPLEEGEVVGGLEEIWFNTNQQVRISDVNPDPVGSASFWPPGSGTLSRMRIRIQE